MFDMLLRCFIFLFKGCRPAADPRNLLCLFATSCGQQTRQVHGFVAHAQQQQTT
jgi:hypothetical protein